LFKNKHTFPEMQEGLLFKKDIRGLRSFVGNGSSSQDFVGAAKIILRSSSLETGENDDSGSPSNFISALIVSQLSLDFS
jgi:hypothetical protein